MKGRDKLFFNLLTFLLIVAVGLVGWRAKEVDKQIKRWQADIKKRQERGVDDPVLKATVDKLENDLRTRLGEEFVLERDPLKLTEVIKTRKFLKKFGILEAAESETKLRLSATVTGESGTAALIKYKGRSWVVSENDKMADTGYKIETIGVNRVVLIRGGERMVLITEKAPDTKAEEERLYGPEGERKPVIEVKQVSDQGNY